MTATHQVLTVGQPSQPLPLLVVPKNNTNLFASIAKSVDFERIQDAIDAIGTLLPPATFEHRYTILIMPGQYYEQIVMKSFVNLVGLDMQAVYIRPPYPPRSAREQGIPPYDDRMATVTLASYTNITSVSIYNPPFHRGGTPDYYAIRGHDVSDIGFQRVDIFPWSELPGKDTNYSRAKALRMSGLWTTLIAQAFGATCYGNGYSVELLGPGPDASTSEQEAAKRRSGWTPIGWNADCHFISSFFDSLYQYESDSGCVLVQDCYEVHVRDSIVRTTNNNARPPSSRDRRFSFPGDGPPAGAALAVRATPPGHHWNALFPEAPLRFGKPDCPLVNAIVEGSFLQCPGLGGLSPRVLDLGDFTECHLQQSSTPTIRAPGITLKNVGPSPWVLVEPPVLATTSNIFADPGYPWWLALR